jgi:PTH1 family peptidyl-tRNA hydrolase
MEPLLIAGLGNPGDQYISTRHNAGADLINLICDKYSLSLKKENQIHGLYAIYESEKCKIIIVRPSTYMNESGICISKAKKYFGLKTEQILIAHDELDLPNAEIKLKESGGHGGHNGLRNIIDQLQGDKCFKRLRIGIGHPGKDKDVVSYVLKKAPTKERQYLIESLYEYLDIGEKITQDGWQKTVMNYHSKKEESNES